MKGGKEGSLKGGRKWNRCRKKEGKTERSQGERLERKK